MKININSLSKSDTEITKLIKYVSVKVELNIACLFMLTEVKVLVTI